MRVAGAEVIATWFVIAIRAAEAVRNATEADHSR